MVDSLMADDVRKILLETIEASLEAQLTAVRRLRTKAPPGIDSTPANAKKSTSQLKIVEDILIGAGHPLHVSEIIARAQSHFSRKFNRESLVSSLTKCVAQGNRFTRTAPNTFGLLPRPPLKPED